MIVIGELIKWKRGCLTNFAFICETPVGRRIKFKIHFPNLHKNTFKYWTIVRTNVRFEKLISQAAQVLRQQRNRLKNKGIEFLEYRIFLISPLSIIFFVISIFNSWDPISVLLKFVLVLVEISPIFLIIIHT